MSNQFDKLLDLIFDCACHIPDWVESIDRVEEHLKGTPDDMQVILRAVGADFETAHKSFISDMLYQHFRKRIIKRLNKKIIKWYGNDYDWFKK